MSKTFLVHAGATAAIVSAVFGAGAIASGCGGISPGDYVIYRVSFAQASKSAGCYGGTVPADVKSDTSTYREAATFILYAGAKDARYLDTGDTTLTGTQNGDSFEFTGKTVDVNYADSNGTGAKTTESEVMTIDMQTDGDAVSGTVVTKTTEKCTGDAACPAETSCTQTVSFVGTKIDNVQLQHDATQGGDGSPSPTTGPTGGVTTGAGVGGGTTTGGVGGGTTTTTTSGVGGSGGSCTTCSVYVTGDHSSTICSQSGTLLGDLFNCACTTCGSTCSNACSSLTIDSTCQACVETSCSSQWSACQNDF